MDRDALHVGVTGAGGFVGSELVRELRRRGVRVRALLHRPGARDAELEALGAECRFQDLSRAFDAHALFGGLDVLVHAAAKVGDAGPRRAYRAANCTATERVLDGLAAAGVARLVHVSTVDVHGRLRPLRRKELGLLDEDTPLPTRLRGDPYAVTKWQAERAVWAHPGRFERIVVRPGWVYGAGETASFPRLAAAMRAGIVPLFDRGLHDLNLVHVRDLAGALAELAVRARVPEGPFHAVGDHVNVRDFLSRLARELGAPQPGLQLPARLAFRAGWLCEAAAACRLLREPPLTRHAVRLLGPQPTYEARRLRELLDGWPRVSLRDGIAETAVWLRSQETRASTPVTGRACST